MHSVAAPPKDPLTEPGPWNAVATGYDDVVFGQLPELSLASIELLAPEKEDTVLDVAAGPGTLAVRLAPRVHRVVAVDFAEAMIERLRLRVMQHHLHNLEVRLMDGQELLFGSGSFDSAISMFGLFLFDDRKRALEELFRVVVPGGRVVISSWATPEQNTMLGVGMEAVRAALPRLATTPRAFAHSRSEQMRGRARQRRLRARAHAVVQGQRQIRVGEEYWHGFERASAPLALLKTKLGEDAFAQARLRIEAELRTRCGDGSFSLDCAAIFSCGEVPRSAA